MAIGPREHYESKESKDNKETQIETQEHDKNKLQSSERYDSNGYHYETDKQGRIKHCEGTLRLEKNNERNPYAQLKAGGEDRRRDGDDARGKDDGGHLIGRRFGGSKDLDNLIAQNSRFNRGEYKSMEDDWQKRLEEKNDDGSSKYKVDVDIRCKYKGDSERPDVVYVYSKVTDSDGNVVEKKVYRYHNESESLVRPPRDLPNRKEA